MEKQFPFHNFYIFLMLSLRLLPSLVGFLFILLHAINIASVVSGCAAVAHASGKLLYGADMVATVLTTICQGSVSVLIFTCQEDFLGRLQSYVREEDGVVILWLGGGGGGVALCVIIFCLEWVILTLAFFLNYYAYVVRGGKPPQASSVGGKVVDEEEMKKDNAPNLPMGETVRVTLTKFTRMNNMKKKALRCLRSRMTT